MTNEPGLPLVSRQRWKLWGCAIALVSVMACYLASSRLVALGGTVLAISCMAASLLVLLGWAISIRCPACGSKLVMEAMGRQPAATWLRWLLDVRACPRCGFEDRTPSGPMSGPHGHATEVHWMPRIALGLAALGLVSISVGLGIEAGRSAWIRAGASAWLLAYLVVLYDNFKRGIPVQTRGGQVTRREDGPVKYALPFIPMVFMGVVALLVVMTA